MDNRGYLNSILNNICKRNTKRRRLVYTMRKQSNFKVMYKVVDILGKAKS
ncbi:hypothetical protein HYC85_022704 [Camellia sinensis]|uniref:Uncharacterized protein n=1 Tax=Camellia sinensis TaxID=4442 RepID=A0A7J7GDP8_CAMSI|nr:hypothetical protein HYC85_022704 [Camellia sinensis]